jgi:OOP family OmpA-OmpF porin
MRHTRGGGKYRPWRASAYTLRIAALAMVALATQAAAQPSPQPTGPQTRARYTQGAKGKVVGAIISRNGDEMVVRRENSNELSTVTLTAGTTVESPSGPLNVDRKDQPMTLLVPGLFVKVRGRGGANNNLVAERISFHKTALKVVNQINAEETALQRQVSAGEVDLKRKIARNSAEVAKNSREIAKIRDSIGDMSARAIATDSMNAMNAMNAPISPEAYDVKATGQVTFMKGSDALTPEAKQVLDALAMTGMGLNGYLIEVTGFADTNAGEAANSRLAERRAQNVVTYLMTQHQIPQRRIMNPTGLGTAQPVAYDSTAAAAPNRRAQIRVLVPR